MKVKVYPTAMSSLAIRHPSDGALREGGTIWTMDGFTARMLADGAVTKDKSKAYGKVAQDTPTPAPAPAAPVTPEK